MGLEELIIEVQCDLDEEYSYREWGEEVVDSKEVEHWEVIADDCAGFG